MSEFSRNLAFIIGINNYTNGISPLQNAVNDAKKLVEILREKHEYQVWVCLDEVATLNNLNKLLEKILPEQVSENDRLLFYFAGHGIALNGDDGPAGYLIPQGAKLGDVQTYLPMAKLQECLNKLPCRHFLGILDCCFAGAFRWSSNRDLLTAPEVIHKERYDRFITDPAWQVITSAASDQKALDAFALNAERRQIGNHSPFAAALIEALAGKADVYPPAINGKPSGDGVITATELYLYLRDAVEPATEGNRQRQTPGIHPLKKHDKGEYIFLSPGHPLNLPPAPPLDASKNPYRGLKSFDEKHSELFFGRTELVEKLQNFVKIHPLTVVLGASGSGKSSLVKAGLIPKLRKDKTEQWSILEPIRPGETPLLALNNTLKNAQLPELEAQNPQQNLAMSIDFWAKNNPNFKLLLFIDQGEEIITLCQNEDERKEFFQEILTAINAHRDKLRVVLSLRSDFEPQVRDAGLKFVPTNYNAGNTELKSRWHSGRFIVPAMTRGDLREAIEKPAETRVMYFQPHELVEQLIDEVADMPGALPLLSFALSELYLKYLKRQRDAENRGITIDRALTQADYQDLGGVIQSLTQKADEEYEMLVKENPAYAQIIRHVMLRMVALGGGELARRQVPLSELEYPPEKNGLVKEVIERFSKARLLVEGQDAEGNPYVEPAHDALVRGWQKLLGWKQEEGESLLLQRRLTPAAQEWKKLKSKEQPLGFQVKTENVIDWLDRKLYIVENLFNNSTAQLIQLLQRTHNQQELYTEKPVQFLWDANPYLNVLDKEFNSNDNWLNQVEAEFVQQSVLQKRQNKSWRWRIAIAVMLGLSGLSTAALIGQRNAQIEQIEAFQQASNAEWSLNQDLDAAINALRAGNALDKLLPFGLFKPDAELAKVRGTLQKLVYTQRVKEYNRLEEDSENVLDVVFSPDGQTIVAANSNNSVTIWSLEGKKLQTLTGHDGEVKSVAFSPDGQTIASASNDKTIKLWKRNSTGQFETQPDKTLTGHNGGVKSVAFSPDGQTIATASLDSTVKLWSIEGQELQTLSGHNGEVTSVAFSPDGQMLVASVNLNSGTIKLWKRDNSTDQFATQPDIIPDEYIRSIRSVAFSPDGQRLALGTEDKTVILLNLQGQVLQTLTGHTGWVFSVAFSPDKKTLTLASSTDRTVKLWRFEGKKLPTLSNVHKLAIWRIAISPDGQTLASASIDGIVKLWKWDDSTGQFETQPYKTLTGHNRWIKSVAFSPDGQIIATASDDRTVKLWSIEGQELQTLTGHNGGVESVAFSHNGKVIASAGGDTIILWKRDNTGRFQTQPYKTLIEHRSGINSVAFSPDDQTIATASKDSTVKLWNLDRSQVLRTLTGHKASVDSVVFSPDGQTIATASGDTAVKLWKRGFTGQFETQPYKTLTGHTSWVTNVAFSPDGQMLASAAEDTTVKLWTLEGKELQTLYGHGDGNWIRSIVFRPNDKKIVSAGTGKIILWNLEDLSLDKLMEPACAHVRNYLQNKPESDSDRHLCDDVKK